ncbi:MAG: hypothetical protein KKB25_00610 [Nanoarchaeota archaeon]|nr:hypothetical protein [Nanoarchaeota archaeon]
MERPITSYRHKLHTQGKEDLESGLEKGLREYEKVLPYIDDLPPEKLRGLRRAVKQNSDSYGKIKAILFPDGANGNPAVVAAQEILDVIKLSVRGEDAGYIAETIFQSDEEAVNPLLDLLGLKDAKEADSEKYNGGSKPKITWGYR